METLTITEEPLSLGELVEVIDGAAVALSPQVTDRIDRGRDVVDRALASGDAVRHDHACRARSQRAPHRRAGARRAAVPGDVPRRRIRFPLPTEIVRAAPMVRLNGIARGGSGASRAAAPATLDVPSLERGAEDQGTGAPLSALLRLVDEALDDAPPSPHIAHMALRTRFPAA